MTTRKPMIAVTTDLIDRNGNPTAIATTHYANAIDRAGGLAVLLPPVDGAGRDLAMRFDGFVFTGGDDPVMEPFGKRTDPRVDPVRDERQAFETELLRTLAEHRPDTPVLGVCLGMQMMALIEGGDLDQYMPETCPTHAEHWEYEHRIEPMEIDENPLGSGTVHSKHKQAVSDPGPLTVCARSHDGLIEGIIDTRRRFYLGVQWHPERTREAALGQRLFDQLVGAI